MRYYPQFGQLLNQQLAKLDRSPAWLARHLGVKNSTVGRWLNDGARPGSPETVILIADILGLFAQREQFLAAAGYGVQIHSGEYAAPSSLLTSTLTEAAPTLGNQCSPRSNLPQPLTPFVGRTAEVAQLTQQLLDPACRLLTLGGPGGIGKTRLAIEVMRATLAAHTSFADGLFFVPLLDINAATQIYLAIAETVGLIFDSQQTIHSHLLHYLHDKRLLLLLDNFEHLYLATGESGAEQPGTEIVSQILANAPQVKVIVTSRMALGVPGEWFYPVDGLDVPEEENLKLEKLASYDSVRLFQQCAQQASPSFDLTWEAQHVAHICRLVDGIPLAIELAAAWLRLLPCVRIAQELERNLVALASPLPNAPLRHRSMQSVLAQTWQMLTAHEAEVFEVLAIFQDSFDDAAATEVAETDLFTLAALAQKSMIRLKQEPVALAPGQARYTIHEMLRQFATAQATQRPEARCVAQARHSHYYLTWLQRQTPHLLNEDQNLVMPRIDADFNNVRAAWQWAVEQQVFELLARAVEGLYHYCEIRGRLRESVLLLEQAVSQVRRHVMGAGMEAEPAHVHLLGHLLACVGAIYADSIDPERAILLLQESLGHLREPRLRAFVLGRLGFAISYRGQEETAEAWLRESIEICRECGDLAGQAYALDRLSFVYWFRADYPQSMAASHEALAIYRTLGRADGTAHVLSNLVGGECLAGEYTMALTHAQESLAICRKVGLRTGEAWALENLGFVAWCQNENLDEAAALMREALVIYQDIGHVSGMCQCLSNMALVANARGEHQQAVEIGQKSVVLAHELKNDHVLAHALTFLGNAQLGNGELVAARCTLLESWALASRINYRICLINALYYLTQVLIEESHQSHTEDAIAMQCQALEWLVFLQQHPTTWQVFKERAAQHELALAATMPAHLAFSAQARGKTLNLSKLVKSDILQFVREDQSPAG